MFLLSRIWCDLDKHLTYNVAIVGMPISQLLWLQSNVHWSSFPVCQDVFGEKHRWAGRLWPRILSCARITSITWYLTKRSRLNKQGTSFDTFHPAASFLIKEIVLLAFSASTSQIFCFCRMYQSRSLVKIKNWLFTKIQTWIDIWNSLQAKKEGTR